MGHVQPCDRRRSHRYRGLRRVRSSCATHYAMVSKLSKKSQDRYLKMKHFQMLEKCDLKNYQRRKTGIMIATSMLRTYPIADTGVFNAMDIFLPRKILQGCLEKKFYADCMCLQCFSPASTSVSACFVCGSEHLLYHGDSVLGVHDLAAIRAAAKVIQKFGRKKIKYQREMLKISNPFGIIHYIDEDGCINSKMTWRMEKCFAMAGAP